MPKYHINKQTERVGICHAKRKCPFGDLVEDHYDSKADAVAAHEKMLASKMITIPIIRDELKDMGANQLAASLFRELDNTGIDQEEVSEVLELASILHANQTRRHRKEFNNTPYIEHPMRATIRLLRLGVYDESVIKAALLHDTIEDCSKSFVDKFTDHKGVSEVQARKILANYVSDKYGEETAQLVQSVTNDYVDPNIAKNISNGEKYRIYLQHLQDEVAGNPKALLIKLSDFIDNAGSLHKTDYPGAEAKTKKQAEKYYPCIDVFRSEIKNNAIIDDFVRDEINNRLNKMDVRLSIIIKKYSNM